MRITIMATARNSDVNVAPLDYVLGGNMYRDGPLREGEWSASRPVRFTPDWIGGWVNSRSGLDTAVV